jgi:hypothetical protein
LGRSPTELTTIFYSHLRLPNLRGPGPRIYIPQEQGGPGIALGTGFPFVASYDSQGYSGGILTRLHTGRNNWLHGVMSLNTELFNLLNKLHGVMSPELFGLLNRLHDVISQNNYSSYLKVHSNPVVRLQLKLTKLTQINCSTKFERYRYGCLKCPTSGRTLLKRLLTGGFRKYW